MFNKLKQLTQEVNDLKSHFSRISWILIEQNKLIEKMLSLIEEKNNGH